MSKISFYQLSVVFRSSAKIFKIGLGWDFSSLQASQTPRKSIRSLQMSNFSFLLPIPSWFSRPNEQTQNQAFFQKNVRGILPINLLSKLWSFFLIYFQKLFSKKNSKYVFPKKNIQKFFLSKV